MPKYNSVSNIPAKLFFDILESKDFDLLEPEENEVGLEQVFSDIYNEYFIKSDNQQSKRFLELEQNIFFMNYKIQSILMVLDFLTLNKTTKEIRETLLKALIDIGVDIDLQNEFDEEVKNILNVSIGILQNDLSFLEIEIEEIKKMSSKKDFDYYDTIVNMESILERNLPEDILLIKYISYEKICEKKVSAIAKTNQNRN